MTKITVKRWVVDKAQDTAARYNVWIDAVRDENGMFAENDGFITVWAEEIISESEKAIKVRLASGSVQGSVKGWTLWIPKSQIAA